MKSTILRTLGVAICAIHALGCGSTSDEAGASASATATAAAKSTTPTPVATPRQTASAAPAKPLASNAVVIDSIRVAIEPPENVTGSAHEMGGGVAILDFKGYEVSLTVGHAHGNMAHTTKKREAEEGFQKWIESTDDTAIAEVKVGNAKEYYGFMITKLGEQHFECGTLTKRKRTSPNEKAVRASLELCKGLRLK